MYRQNLRDRTIGGECKAGDNCESQCDAKIYLGYCCPHPALQLLDVDTGSFSLKIAQKSNLRPIVKGAEVSCRLL